MTNNEFLLLLLGVVLVSAAYHLTDDKHKHIVLLFILLAFIGYIVYVD